MEVEQVAALIWLLLPFLLMVYCLYLRRRLKTARAAAGKANQDVEEREQKILALRDKLAPIASMEDELSRLGRDIEKGEADREAQVRSYTETQKRLKHLKAEVAVYNEALSFAEFGVYQPHFDFNDSEAYKDGIERVRNRQKEMITAKGALDSPTTWTIDGSRAKGQTMLNRQTRLTMRAFNNECDVAIANTRWNNVNAMEKRIMSAAKAIDEANASLKLKINDKYLALKLEELHLTHEYRERLKIEKEERAELARAEREERKLLAEAEAADKEEKRYLTLLDKARKEAGSGEISAAMQARITELETALAEARAASERARSLAEMTKCGYVYIISNIGSFGENVVKIGLTRRLDPDDRVRELGDASVPFGFDIHAMIYSDEAPALEAALHRAFADRRVNTTNLRKEFFHVGLDEVEDAVRRLAPEAGFFKDREAQEWQETVARRNASLGALESNSATPSLPAA